MRKTCTINGDDVATVAKAVNKNADVLEKLIARVDDLEKQLKDQKAERQTMAEINIEKMAQNVAKKAIQELENNGVLVYRWIPVSESLPEEFQRVLITIVNYNGYKVVRVAEYYNRVFRVKENYEQWEVGEKGLLAWTPLPKPFEHEGES